MATTSEQTEKRDPSNYDALLERAEELETWHGIRFERLSVHYDRSEHELYVFCEIRPTNGQKLKHDIKINVAIYDLCDRIIAQNQSYALKEEFYGFTIVQIKFYYLAPKKMANIGKIKVYPTHS